MDYYKDKAGHTNLHLHAYHGPFHFISTPPLWKRSIKIYPLRNQRTKVPTRAPPPLRNCLNSLFPSEKSQFFSKPPRKYSKDQRRRRSDPLRNDDQGPLRKSFPLGGCALDIKWNGPIQCPPLFITVIILIAPPGGVKGHK